MERPLALLLLLRESNTFLNKYFGSLQIMQLIT